MCKKSCIDCHFFYCNFVNTGVNYRRENTVLIHLRDEFKRNRNSLEEFGNHKNDDCRSSLYCYCGIWDEGVGTSKSERYKNIIKKRRGSCFYQFQKGMLMQEAIKRRDEQNNLKRSIITYLVGTIIVSTIIANVINHLIDKYFWK